MADFEQTVELLRALGEPTRCRLLALFRHGELTVGEIAAVVGQSQPRISRHLKLLSDVGVLERFQEEQRVYYRLAASGDEGNLTRYVLDQIAQADPVLDRDLRHLAPVLKLRVRDAEAKWEDVRRSAESTYADAQLVRRVLNEVGSETLGNLLDIGTGSGNMLRILAPRARQATGMDISAQALRLARSNVHGSGLSHCTFKRGDMYDLPFAAGSFDAVSFDHLLSTAERPIVALREARRVLRRGGRLIVVDDSRQLSIAADTEPQSLLQSWLTRVGLQCEKIKPIRGGQSQLVFALARRGAAPA